MRAHGDSSASSVMDTFAEASDSSQANLNGGSSHRAALVSGERLIMSIFPLGLSQNLEAEGKMRGVGGMGGLRFWNAKPASLSGPPDRTPLPGPGPRDAASHHRDLLVNCLTLQRRYR